MNTLSSMLSNLKGSAIPSSSASPNTSRIDDDDDADDDTNGQFCVVCKVRSRHPGFTTCGLTCGSKNKQKPTMCQVKPKHGSYPTCGLKCASKLKAGGQSSAPVTPRRQKPQASGLCTQCQAKFKAVSPSGKVYDQCGTRCRDAANLAQLELEDEMPPKRKRTQAQKLCVYCQDQPKAKSVSGRVYNYCSQECQEAESLADLMAELKVRPRGASQQTPQSSRRRSVVGATSSPRSPPPSQWQALKAQAKNRAPVLLDIPKTEDAFDKVLDQFQSDWKSTNRPAPKVHRIFVIYQKQDIIARHEQFKEQLNRDSIEEVHESRRWIGVGHTCNIVKSGIVNPCQNLNCTLCDIIRRNIFSQEDFPRMIPATGTSNKADKLAFPGDSGTTKSRKAMLFTKVASSDEEEMTAEQVVSLGNSRRQRFIQLQASDQLLVFTADAIAPKYLVIYS